MRENDKGRQEGVGGSGLESGQAGRQAGNGPGALDREKAVSNKSKL